MRRPSSVPLARAGAAAALVALAVVVAVVLVRLVRQGPDGRAVFARACASCHTLGARASHAPGGDLGDYRLSAADVESFARVMPVHPGLSDGELRTVAAYVARHERR